MELYTSIFKSLVYWTSLSKIDVDIINQEFYFNFVLSNCPSDIIRYFLTGAG